MASLFIFMGLQAVLALRLSRQLFCGIEVIASASSQEKM